MARKQFTPTPMGTGVTVRYDEASDSDSPAIVTTLTGVTMVARTPGSWMAKGDLLTGALDPFLGPEGVSTLYQKKIDARGNVIGSPITLTGVALAGPTPDPTGGAPASLDTFDELAAGIGDDPNFATTMATALAKRLTTVSHAATAATARPTSTLPVLWIGTVAPTNALARDLWLDETGPALKRTADGSAWVSAGGTLVASSVVVTPVGNIAATDAQAALAELDTEKQAADADLTTIAALDSTTAGALATDGSGWIRKTYAQLKTALTLVKADVGLGNVDNTADTAKPVSTAQQTALDAKALLTETVNTVATSGAAQTIPDVTSSTISRITLSANCTLTFPTAAAGKSFTLALVQDGTGSRTVTWPGTVKWAGGTAPTLSTGASKIDYISFICTDGTNWAGFVAGLDMR